MISDSERREVAARLRSKKPEECTAPFGKPVLMHIFHSVFPNQIFLTNWILRLPYQLADLIDRPTCNDVGDDWEFHCSACGCELDIRDMEVGEPTMWKDGAAQVPKYCPSCGAEVVNDA